MSNIINKQIMKKILYTVIAILGFANLTMAQVPTYVPTNGLVGYWPFNGNANDESGNGNNGTVNGAVLVSDRKGASNKAYSFDGINDVISIPDNSTFESNRHSISFWIKYSNLPSSMVDILGKDNSSGNRQFIVQLESTGKIRTALFTDSKNAILDTREPLKSSLWSHVVVVYDSSYYEIYINGVSDTAMFTKGTLLQASIPFNIGGTPSFNQYFKGEIDDVCFWSRPLNGIEITNLYSQCVKSITQQPTNRGMFSGNAKFSCLTNDTLVNYQWQSDLGMGWNNLSNVGQYSGTTTNTLQVSNVTSSNNNQKFRCIIKGDCLTDTTNEATLKVWGLGVENEIVDELIVYPNPSSTQVIIDNGNYNTMGSYTAKIVNSIGQQVFQSVINQQQFVIDANTMGGAGVYTLYITDGNNKVVGVKKIVLQ